jgi:hypothetical protein
MVRMVTCARTWEHRSMQSPRPRPVRPLAPIERWIALLCLAGLAGCASSGKRSPFRYRSQSAEVELGRPWRAQLDGKDPGRWAASVRLRLPRAGVLRVTSTLEPSAPVAIAVFVAGKRPIAQVRAPRPLRTPPIGTEAFVVVRAGRSAGAVAATLRFELLPEGAAKPAPKPASGPPPAPASRADPATSQPPEPGLSPPPGYGDDLSPPADPPAPGADLEIDLDAAGPDHPSLSDLKDLEFDDL